jgi:ADP-ribose pyrophosphatase YjhB (NUDIX family)
MSTASGPATSREYPDHPRVGVGAVVLDGDRVLLVRRGRGPAEGKWSIPGGLVDLGERIEEAARREVLEECGIPVRIAGLAGVVDRVIRDPGGRVRYHYVLVDYVAHPESRSLRPGSDAAEARWVPIAEVPTYDTTDGLLDMIQRAAAVSRGGHA